MSFNFRERTLSMWEGGRRVLQIFQKIFRSPGDYRPKYFMPSNFSREYFMAPPISFLI